MATVRALSSQLLPQQQRRAPSLPFSPLPSSFSPLPSSFSPLPSTSLSGPAPLPLLKHRSPSTALRTRAIRTAPRASYGANPGSYGTPQPSYGSPQPPRSEKYTPAGAADEAYTYVEEESPEEAARRAQASKRVDRTARYFRRLGVIGFWGQLVCSLVAAVILAFSIIITGTPSAPVSTYLTFAGILAAFASVFWSFGYLRMADRLKLAVNNPMKAPPRAAVVANLKNGLIINILGMGATLLGLQSTVGVLVAKALTSSTPIYGAVGTPPGFNPVLALDVFLVQASGNTALSHFLGLVLTLELLRSTTQSQPPSEAMLPKAA